MAQPPYEFADIHDAVACISDIVCNRRTNRANLILLVAAIDKCEMKLKDEFGADFDRLTHGLPPLPTTGLTYFQLSDGLATKKRMDNLHIALTEKIKCHATYTGKRINSCGDRIKKEWEKSALYMAEIAAASSRVDTETKEFVSKASSEFERTQNMYWGMHLLMRVAELRTRVLLEDRIEEEMDDMMRSVSLATAFEISNWMAGQHRPGMALATYSRKDMERVIPSDYCQDGTDEYHLICDAVKWLGEEFDTWASLGDSFSASRPCITAIRNSIQRAMSRFTHTEMTIIFNSLDDAVRSHGFDQIHDQLTAVVSVALHMFAKAVLRVIDAKEFDAKEVINDDPPNFDYNTGGNTDGRV